MTLYTCHVFITDKKSRKYHNVNSYGIDRLVNYLRGSEPGAKYFNVYDKKTGEYLKRVYIFPENHTKTP